MKITVCASPSEMSGKVQPVIRFFLLAVLAICSISGSGCRPPVNEEPPPGKEPVLVNSTFVQNTDLATFRNVSAPLEAVRQVEFAAEIGGRITKIHFENGDSVHEGDIILEIDHREIDLQIRQLKAQIKSAEANLNKWRSLARPQELKQARSALESAEANLVAAREEYQRAVKLKEEGVYSASQLETAEARFESARATRDSAREALDLLEEGARTEDLIAAEAQLEQLRSSLDLALLRLDYAVVEAPFTGKVANLDLEEQELIAPGARLFTIVDDSAYLLKIGLSDREVRQVTDGESIEVTMDMMPDWKESGVVVSVGVLSNPVTHTFPVEIGISADPMLRAGMIATAHVKVQSTKDVPSLPVDAVLERGGDFFVFVPENGAARRRTVAIGLKTEGSVQIISGLQTGDEVLYVGHKDLRDGDPIRLTDN
jgi:HlyD family secretion protein